MLAMYFVPFVLILTAIESNWLIVLMWGVMGVGMAGIGLSIMHDANHHAYSRNNAVNMSLGFLLNVVGGSDVNWRVQHNVLHHTYTNVTGYDEDIDPGNLLRFSPEQPLRKVHKNQHIFAWFLYGFMTIKWILTKDYFQHARYVKEDLLKTQGIPKGRVLAKLIASKVIYLTLTIGLPIYFSPMAWWGTVLCFFMMHYIAGLILACVFQPAHVIPETDFPMPDEDGNIKQDWAVNQIRTTANFAMDSRLLSWYVGGLNFQVEHHLFPSVCHIHYKKIAPIVRQTAEEYGLPYYYHKTFLGALAGHKKMLYKLGHQDVAPAIH
jgi:linoleoyl-CoA desaturase